MIASTGVKRIGTAFVLTGLLVALCASAASQAQSASVPTAAEKSKLRILYAGHRGTDREKDFVDFLKKYFEVVQTGNLQTFKEADTQGFDVTLLDWDWNDPNGPKPKISQTFSRPVVTLGIPGGLICRQWHLKTGYM